MMKMLGNGKVIDTWLEIFLSELIGTGFLMYLGCLGLFAAAGEWKMLAPMQGGMVWGFTVSTIIVAIGHLSKAHLNPCVTLCAYLLGHISIYTASIYVLAEMLGALIGMCLLKISVPDELYRIYDANASPCGFCATAVHPDLNLAQAFILEFLATSLLILVVCSMWDHRNQMITDSNPVKFALVIAVISIAVGPFTGASMNPARSFAPAVVNNGWQNHWLYWLAPLSGSMLTTLYYKWIILKRIKPEKSKYSDDAERNSAQLRTSSTSLSPNDPAVYVLTPNGRV